MPPTSTSSPCGTAPASCPATPTPTAKWPRRRTTGRRRMPTGACSTRPGTTSTTGPAPAPGAHGGYWMVGSDGKVYGFGNAHRFGDAGVTPGHSAVDLEPTPSGDGYWVVDDAGGVSSFGDAVYRGAPDS